MMFDIEIHEWLNRLYDHAANLSISFAVFFFVRCTCIHFGAKNVPNPWIIDASWYFATTIGIVLAIPLMFILMPSLFNPE